MDNENLIATLEQSLRQMRQSHGQKSRRLREIESEAEGLRQEVQMLDSSIKQIQATMHSLLFSSRSTRGNQNYPLDNHLQDFDLEDFEEIHSKPQRNTQHNSYSARPIVRMPHDGRHTIPPINPDTEVKNHRFADRTITQCCTILMREAGRPLHVNELYNRLLESGFVFTGNNPTISIAVSLNRNRRFRKVSPGTFDLVMRDASQAAS
jgi:hypothetical protein